MSGREHREWSDPESQSRGGHKKDWKGQKGNRKRHYNREHVKDLTTPEGSTDSPRTLKGSHRIFLSKQASTDNKGYQGHLFIQSGESRKRTYRNSHHIHTNPSTQSSHPVEIAEERG